MRALCRLAAFGGSPLRLRVRAKIG
jgi:hypothetical protein